MTGELSIHAKVKPIGGVIAKVKAAKMAGAKTVIIPKENEQAILKKIDGIEVIAVTTLDEVFDLAFCKEEDDENVIPAQPFSTGGIVPI